MGYMVAEQSYEKYCRRLGVPFFPLGVESVVAEDGLGEKFVNPLDAVMGQNLILGFQRSLMSTCEAERPDLLVAVTGATIFVQNVALKLGIPYGLLFSVPIPFPGEELPAVVFGTGMMPRFLNAASNEAFLFVMWHMLKERYTVWRNDLGVPVEKNFWEYRENYVKQNVFVSLSEHLVPRPKAWPDNAVMGGIIHVIEEETVVDDTLNKFLEDGAPPIFIGFGSMTQTSSPKFLAFLERIIALLEGERIIVFLGGLTASGLVDEDLKLRFSSDRVFPVFNVAHNVVLPKCKLMVHHGGPGTLHAALLAGTPSVMVTFLVDQPLFCDLMLAKQLVPQCLRYSSATPEKVVSVIHKALDPQYKERTLAFRQLLEEDPAEENFNSWIVSLLNKQG
ncbi:hypothetical protein BJ742DRAFT_842458 [Cladochytrium replicatum]|nr:hypothetical protein BJ742DRAFT_842458 [Cladochytrium replicatum]